jgi:septum site-determining protein MinD
MAKNVLVASGKGGTGKSTVSLLLAKALCRLGRRVLVVELASGSRCLDVMSGVSDDVMYDLSDILKGRCAPVKAIVPVKTEGETLHIVASAMDRHYVPDAKRLKTLIKLLTCCYDFMLFDAPPNLSGAFDSAASLCDMSLIVTECQPASLRCSAAALGLLKGTCTRLVINRFSPRQLNREIADLDDAIDRAGARLIAVVPDDFETAAACLSHKLPNTPATRAIFDLARRLMGEEVLLDTKDLK